MTTNEFVLIGYSGHAFVVADALLSSGAKIKGYMDKVEKTSNPFGLSYLGTDDQLNEQYSNYDIIVAIGDNAIRGKIFKLLGDKQLTLGNAIHSSVVIAFSVTLGKGLMIMAGVVVNPLAKIGNGVILNTNCTVEHECVIGDYVHIAPGAVLAGNVSVGDYTFIGANSVVKQGVKIGKNVVVGAGSVILNDIPDNVTVVGNPGRVLR